MEHEVDSSTSSSSSSSSSSASAQSDDYEGTACPPVPFVEGVRVVDASRLDTYNRWRVKCPAHDDCFKHRNRGPRQTKRHGELEPIAYLGVWLSKADMYATKQMHLSRCHPTHAQIDAYLKEHNHFR